MEFSEREKLFRFARTEEDKLFLAKLSDKARQSDRGYLACTHFMDPHQRMLARRFLIEAGIFVLFDGGFDEAERVVALFLPDYRADGFSSLEKLRTEDDYPVSLMRVSYKKNAYVRDLTHRDYLGALMNLGIKRETLGDILLQEDYAHLFVLSEIVPFIENNLTQVGRLSVEAHRVDFSQIILPEPKVELKTVTVASLRLDAIVAEGFNLSRSEAQAYIEAGRVYLQFEECSQGSKAVDEGQTISVRGMGRVILAGVGGQSKKNRLFITLKKLV